MSERRKHLAVYTITTREGASPEGGDEKNEFWTRIGSAFPHPKGEGFNLILNALPLGGKLVVLPAKERDDEGTRAA